LTNFKEKGLCRPKKQAGAELEKKRFFGPKVVGKIEYKRQKLTNSKEKKGLFGPKKNKLGLSLRTKSGFFGPKVGEKRSITAKH